MRNGQIIIEFVFMVGFAILLCMVYLLVSNDLLAQKNDEQRVIALNDVGYTIQDELITATMVDDGYIRTFRIPALADRFTYSLVTQTDTSITLSSADVTMTFDLPLHTGEPLKKGDNTLHKDSQGIRVLP